MTQTERKGLHSEQNFCPQILICSWTSHLDTTENQQFERTETQHRTEERNLHYKEIKATLSVVTLITFMFHLQHIPIFLMLQYVKQHETLQQE